jgi:hypothetical protein
MEAQLWAKHITALLKGTSRRTGEPMPSWLTLAIDYCDEVLAGKPSKEIARQKVNRIGRFEPMQHPIDLITIQNINAYKQLRLSSVSSTTCRDELVMIKRVFRWANSEARARGEPSMENPCDHVTLPRANKPRDKVIEPYELDLLLRMLANMSGGAYTIYEATGLIPDPHWPKKTMGELLELAFKDGRLIDSEDHPIIQQLRGA